MRLGLVVLAIVMFAPPARAEGGAAAAQKLLADQVKAIGAGDAKAFAAAFDGESFAFLPTAAGEGLGKTAIEAAAKTWLAGLGKVRAKLEAPHCGEIYMGLGGFCSGTIALTAGKRTTRLRVLITAYENDEDERHPGKWIVVAEHLSEAIADRTALALAAAGKLPALPALPAMTALGNHAVDVQYAPDRLTRHAHDVDDSPAVVLIGSAPGEVVIGKTAVIRRLKAWKSLRLTSKAFVFGRTPETIMVDIRYVAGHVDGTFHVHGKTVTVPYRSLAIYFDGPAAAEVGTVLEGAHFSVATH